MPQLKYWDGSNWVNASVGAQGTTGSQGIQGLLGVQGFNGTQGLQGTQGIQGIQGLIPDRSGVRYNFSTTVTDADPGTGIIRYNNATIASVTNLFISNLDVNSISNANWLADWSSSTTASNRGYVVVKGNVNTSTVTNIFRITGAVTAAVNYYKIPVAFISGVLPANNATLVIDFSRTGDQGIQGVQGTQGIQGDLGPQGTQGIQGPQGTQGIQGIQGTQGIQGIQGIQGTQGIQGIQGETGIQGLTGLQGTQGLIGLQGPSDGAQGTQGIQGMINTVVYDSDQGVISQQVFG